MGSEINMGYDSVFDPRQLNQVYCACPLLVYTYHTQFFIHRQNSTRLTQALCLTLLFFRLLSSVSPPGPQGGNTAAWPTSTSSLKKRNVLLGLSCFELWLWTIHYGAFAVYLCFIYASLNNVLKTDYESVMLCFWKGCCCNTYLTLWNKVCCSSAVYKYVFLYLSCISVTYTYKPPPKLGHSLWEWP